MNTNQKHFVPTKHNDSSDDRYFEMEVFTHLRKHEGLTTREMAIKLGCQNSLVSHWEVGRQRLPDHRREMYMKHFRLIEGDMEEFKSGKRAIPMNYRNECMLVLNKMNEDTLRNLYPILMAMLQTQR
ncbi:MAG: helix-turn-helix domain-containing protein [Bacteriovoracia bacterium]